MSGQSSPAREEIHSHYRCLFCRELYRRNLVVCQYLKTIPEVARTRGSMDRKKLMLLFQEQHPVPEF